jgi:hypothetical protein
VTILTLISWLLCISGLLLSIVALTAALRSSDRSLLKRYVELSTRFSELEAAHEAIAGKQRSMRVRLSQLSKNPNNDDPDSPAKTTDPDEWQRRTNRELALRRMR